jgi:hypothetical protein
MRVELLQRDHGFKMNASKIDSRKASAGLLMLAMLLATGAIALHSPGHVSMDTSMQLYEASIGKSVSWNPPFMSALMRWLDGGEVATAFIVLICSLLTYVSLGHVVAGVLRNRAAIGNPRIGVWRVVLCALLLFNPVLFVYVGIVWKDVLFSSVMTAGTALSFAAAVSTPRRGFPLALAAAVLLAISMQVRQQGVFMAPVLLFLPIAATVGSRSWPRGRQALAVLALVGVFLVSLLITKALVARSITGAGDASSSVGFRSIMVFDIAGTVARSKTKTEVLPVAISAEQRVAVRRVYSSYRIDYLSSDPVAWAWLDGFTDQQRKQAWLSLIRHEPKAFLDHKWDTFRAVLDLNGLQGCLPVHVGVDGNSDYLRSVGIAESRDARDVLVYRIASRFFDWPVYRHWFYLLALLVALVAIAVVRLPARIKAMCMAASLASGLFYLSFLPTTIACDFRYMYAAIPLVTMLWMVLLAGGLPRQPPASAETGA